VRQISGWLGSACWLVWDALEALLDLIVSTGNSPGSLISLMPSGRTRLSGRLNRTFISLPQAGETPGGYYYASNRLEMAEHGGTHIDAPIHFVKGGQTLDQLPLERLVGAGVRIDVTAQCARDRDYLVTIQDFERWESAPGRIPNRSIVLRHCAGVRH
jgi:hypothetical protein